VYSRVYTVGKYRVKVALLTSTKNKIFGITLVLHLYIQTGDK